MPAHQLLPILLATITPEAIYLAIVYRVFRRRPPQVHKASTGREVLR